MPVLTQIIRVIDGLVLCEMLDPSYSGKQAVALRKEAATVVERMLKDDSVSAEGARLRIDAGDHYICFQVRGEVVCSTMFERSYSEATAFRYLDELLAQFLKIHGADVQLATESHAFMQFETSIEKMRKAYVDKRSQNLHRVTADLNDVQDVMTKNINDILLRGEKISTVAQKSEDLLAGTAKYAKAAKDLNKFSMKQVAAAGGCALLFLLYYFRGWFL